MEKLELQSIIEKYSLDGLIERVHWKIKDKTLTIPLIAEAKNFLGEIVVTFDQEDTEFVVHNTSRLLKLLNITDKEISIVFEKNKHIATKMKISDNNFKLNYVLSDIMLAPKIPKVEEPKYDIEFEIDENLTNKFVKAHKAIGNEAGEKSKATFSISEKNIKILIGDPSNYSNKVEFVHPAHFDKELLIMFNDLNFPSLEIKTIFNNNKCLGKGFISSEGLMKLEFKEVNCFSKYIIIAND